MSRLKELIGSFQVLDVNLNPLLFNPAYVRLYRVVFLSLYNDNIQQVFHYQTTQKDSRVSDILLA